jgi:hypothetical protein
VVDEFAKEYLHGNLREIRETMLWKLDGLPEYDIRRPLTLTGTNLLGLVKHLSLWESRYFGEVFDRPFPELLPDGTTLPSTAPTGGRPSTRPARRSSTATVAYGSTQMRRSPPSPSTPLAACPGGHALT